MARTIYPQISQTDDISNQLKQTKILVILKLRKINVRLWNYRPIALLSMLYKLLKRLVLNKINYKLLRNLHVEHADFRIEGRFNGNKLHWGQLTESPKKLCYFNRSIRHVRYDRSTVDEDFCYKTRRLIYAMWTNASESQWETRSAPRRN